MKEVPTVVVPGYNSSGYFESPLISETGFREYDARWVIEPINGGATELNYVGLRTIGFRLGLFLQHDLGTGTDIVVGHDFRSYSEHVKNAVVLGLLQAGMHVHDIGLSTTPGAYFAQHNLGVQNIAMITASHNDNGWTGLKMGHGFSKTFGPDEMTRFRDSVINAETTVTPVVPGVYELVPEMRDTYIDDLVSSWAPRLEGLPRPTVAVETGNGTAGLYLPALLEKLGFPVSLGNVELDWTFPHFNPNPESIPFLRSVEALVAASGAQVGLCIDGDGDRLGVVDDSGTLVFADRVGLLVGQRLEKVFGTDRPIVIDVKSTSLFERELTSKIVWAKTGHSYVKAAVAESGAIAGFERSGHFFFGEPLGRGYDDACVAALAVLWVLCQALAEDPDASLSHQLAALPVSQSSPNRQPVVSDLTKYEVVDTLARELSSRATFAGAAVIDVNMLNGIRLTLADGSWLLVRASSNSPNLVIIGEAFDYEGELLERMDRELRAVIESTGVEIGPFEPLHQY